MNVRHYLSVSFVVTALAAPALSGESPLPTAFEGPFDAAVRSVCAIEYYIQGYEEREPRSAFGLILDEEGHIATMKGTIPRWVPPERFRDIKAFPLGEDTDGFPVTYLGYDTLADHHFLQLDDDEGRAAFTPVTVFPVAEPRRGELLWGVAANGRDWDFMPYFRASRLGAVVELPRRLGFVNGPIAAPGSVVFNTEGAFVGWAQASYRENFEITLRGRAERVQLRDVDVSKMFLLADEVLSHRSRIPEDPEGDPQPWLGVAGLQTLDKDAAEFLGLDDVGAVVVSDIIVDSPADRDGLEAKDIIIGMDGTPLPQFTPSNVVVPWFVRAVAAREIGSELALTVNRGGDPVEVTLTLGTTPKQQNQAERAFFESVGFAVREFVLGDGVQRRILDRAEMDGVITDYVSRNKPANSAGLNGGDWIKEVDGQRVPDLETAVAAINAALESETREELVLLIERNNETQVLRIKLP